MEIMPATTTPDIEFNSPDRYTQAGTERKRARKACKICHSHKARCSGTIPNCRRCEQRGYVCEYESTGRGARRSMPRQLPAGGATTATSQSGGSPTATVTAAVSAGGSPMDIEVVDGLMDLGCSKLTTKRYIDAYFEFVSSNPGKGFIHRATFLRNWNSGTANPALVKAICASSIAFVAKDDESRATALKWMDEAEKYIWQNLGRPSVALLEVLLVIVFYRLEHREYFKSQALTAVAAKMAFVLGLNYENNGLSTVVRECRRRLMWSIFHVDRLSAGGFPELLVCPSHALHIQLPCSEKDFDLGIPGETASLACTRTNEAESIHMGLRSFYFRISDIRHRVLEYARNIIREKSNPYDSRSQLQKLEAELEQLRRSLPANLQYNEDNLFLRAYSPQLTRFVMFHILWQQCHTDLYRFMYPGTKDSISDAILEQTPAEYVKYCQRKAFDHALAILDICCTVQSIGHTLISDTAIATCVWQCSNIIVRGMEVGWEIGEKERKRIWERLGGITDVLEGLREVNTHVDDVYRNVKELISNANSRRLALPNSNNLSNAPSQAHTLFSPNQNQTHNRNHNHDPSTTALLLNTLSTPPTTDPNTTYTFTPSSTTTQQHHPSPHPQANPLSLLELAPDSAPPFVEWPAGEEQQWIDFSQPDILGSVGAMFDPFWGIHDDSGGGGGEGVGVGGL
ncbi:Nitrate assimilation regulatory protein [Rutstroemia sp. NJR-2017a BVV2]|nr:Nitrate assimilation regulatory protein [Rutstroemia sp. NJR-2017a BVV2]